MFSKKTLARVMSLCLALNTLLGAAPIYAEEAVPEAAEAAEAPVEEESSSVIEDAATELSPETEDAATELPPESENAATENEPSEEEIGSAETAEQDEAPVEDIAEAAETAVEAAGFAAGYCTVTAPVSVYAAADATVAIGTLSAGTLYAQTAEGSRVQIVFNVNAGIATGWVDAASLSFLDDTAAQTYLQTAAADATVLISGDLYLLPATYTASVAQTMTVSIGTETLGIGETTVLTVTATGMEEGSRPTATFNKKYVSVTAIDGDTFNVAVKGVKATGSTPITVNWGTQTQTVNVCVKKAPSSCKVTVARDVLISGETEIASAQLTNGTSSVITWTSDNEAVATVAADGTVTAVAPGTAVITAHTFKSNVSGSVKVTVYNMPAALAFDRSEVLVGVGASCTAALHAYDANGVLSIFSGAVYASSDESVFTVDGNGKLTGNAYGTAVLRVTANGLTAETTVRTVSLSSAGTVAMGVGNTLNLFTEGAIAPVGFDDLSQITCTYKSSNTKVARVSADGVVTAVKKGTAVITVTADTGSVAQVKISVSKYPGSFKLNTNALTLGVGMARSLTVTLSKKTYTRYTFTSDNTNVATASADGTVVAVAPGTCNIYCSAVSGKYLASPAVCAVTVTEAPASIAFAAESFSVCAGDTRACAAVLPEGTTADITYTSSDTNVFTVDGDGRVTVVASAAPKSEAVLTATAHNGVSASCRIIALAAPVQIAFADTSVISVGVGETLKLPDVVAWAADGSVIPVSWTLKSSKAKLVTVDSEGYIKALKKGTVTITASIYNGMKCTLKVTVYKYPSSMKLSSTALTMGAQCSRRLTVTFSKNSYTRCAFASSNEAVATVSENGTVTAVAPGECTISCTATTGKFAATPLYCTVTVLPAPDSIRFTADSITVCAGDSIATQVQYTDGTLADITYYSGDQNIFAVDSDGKVKAIATAAGYSAVLTAVTQNGLQATCVVNVIDAPYGIAFADSTALVIAKGDTVALPAAIVYSGATAGVNATVTYKSSKPKIVSVDSNGNIRGLKAGSAIIYATTYNGCVASVRVTVSKNAVTAVTLSASEHTFYIRPDEGNYGDPLTLTATCMIGTQAAKASVTWASSDTAVATVSASGVVNAVAPGTAVITATSANGKQASCAVTVYKASRTLSFSNASSLGVNRTLTMAPVFDDAGSSSALTWASSNEGILTVDANGVVTGIATGTARVTATGTYGLTASMNITVLPGPTTITLRGTNAYLHPGETIELSPTFSPASGICTDVTCGGYDSAIVSVNGTAVTAIAAGTTTVTVTGCNGTSAACAVTVLPATEATDMFSSRSAVMVTGTTATLDSVIKAGANLYQYGYSLVSGDTNLFTVKGTSVTAVGKSGTANITLMSNGVALDTISVTIIAAVTPVVTVDGAPIADEGITLYKQNSGRAGSDSCVLAVALTTGSTDPLIGATDVGVRPANAALATVTRDVTVTDEYVATLLAGTQTGTTKLIITVNGTEYRYTLTVKDVTYRALVIGEFNNSGDAYDLPFSSLNTSAVGSMLGKKYSVTRITNNPTASVIASNISSTFGSAGSEDVSLIYLVAHGNYDSTGSYVGKGKFYFSIPTGYNSRECVSSDTLMSWISGIQGNVVLVIDTCYSGYFISNERSALAAAGNISVITAQSSYAATWYMDSSVTMEFFTSIMLRSLGSSDKSSYLSMLSANSDVNGDGVYTVSEMMSWTAAGTAATVKYYSQKFLNTGSFYAGNYNNPATIKKNSGWSSSYWHQSPQTYIPSGMEDLVIF